MSLNPLLFSLKDHTKQHLSLRFYAFWVNENIAIYIYSTCLPTVKVGHPISIFVLPLQEQQHELDFFLPRPPPKFCNIFTMRLTQLKIHLQDTAILERGA
jgi:hypothetical protein